MRRLPLLLLAALPVCARALDSCDFSLLLDAGRTPENRFLRLDLQYDADTLAGRVHFNGDPGPFSNHWPSFPVFAGRTTCSDDAVAGLDPAGIQQRFPGGLTLAYPEAVLARPGDLDAIRGACAPQHRWPADVDGQPLTTLLRFDHLVYRVAQYLTEATAPQDTAFHLPWTTLDLPRLPEAEPLVWIEGVGRVKGVVEGELTVLCSDSLFLTGDVIVADAVLASCYPVSSFGTVPVDSPNRIGLIGEKDVIVAATLENGFANGGLTPGLTCGLPNDDPVISTCQQDRKDIVITAAILAAGCGFETEYWNTTARDAEPPDPSQQIETCGGWGFQQTRIWSSDDCPGPPSWQDQRGTLWLHGSLAARALGVLNTAYTQEVLGSGVQVGYSVFQLRPDVRLADRPPPWWPRMDWRLVDEDGAPAPPPVVEPFHGPESACGSQIDPAGLWRDWMDGAVGLGFQRFEERCPLEVRCRLHADDAVLEETTFALPASGVWRPAADPLPALLSGHRIWISASCEVFESDYNADGEECSWWLGTAVDAPRRPSTPALGVPYPNPFNPATRVTVTLARPETVRLALVDLLGREARVMHEGPLPAGEHAISVDGAGLPSGLYLLRLEHGDGAVEVRKALLLR